MYPYFVTFFILCAFSVAICCVISILTLSLILASFSKLLIEKCFRAMVYDYVFQMTCSLYIK